MIMIARAIVVSTPSTSRTIPPMLRVVDLVGS